MVFSKLQVCAFKHLLRMIRKELVKVRGLYPHWADRMAHLNVRENEASATGREIKRGRGGESPNKDFLCPSHHLKQKQD